MQTTDQTCGLAGVRIPEVCRDRSSKTIIALCCAALLFPFLAGCGKASGPKTASVTGKVTYAGQPVKDAAIVFAPADLSKTQPGTAVSDKNGYYTAMTNQNLSGLMAGEYKISVVAYKVPLKDIPPVELAKMGDSNLAVPKKYNDLTTSGLTLTIGPKDSSKTLDLKLTD